MPNSPTDCGALLEQLRSQAKAMTDDQIAIQINRGVKVAAIDNDYSLAMDRINEQSDAADRERMNVFERRMRVQQALRILREEQQDRAALKGSHS